MKIKKKFQRLKSKAISCRKSATLAMFTVLMPIASYAQAGAGKGIGGFKLATDEFTSYAPAVQKLLYAIAGIIALVGAFNIFFKMQNGDQDVKKTIMQTVGGCVAFIACAAGLPAFFK